MQNLKWQTYEGIRLHMHEIKDEHLANILRYITKFKIFYPVSVIGLFEDEVANRKLSKEFINGAPYDFIDSKGVKRSGNYIGERNNEIIL